MKEKFQKKKILILNKLLSSLKPEAYKNINDIIVPFNILELISEKRVFEYNEHFDYKGTYIISKTQNIVEINWRKTIYVKNE